jgi:glucosamine kinase
MDYKLIVDSGSTKTDWVVRTPDQSIRFSTQGINPSSNEDVFDLKQEAPAILEFASSVKVIHYFGAGVIDDHTRSIIKKWLGQYFKNTEQYQIESDMLGCAIATCGNKEGIIGILGTGSNSCVYDGKEITHNIPALGYALSNEGGGSKIGSELIKAYFYGQLPSEVEKEFDAAYRLSKSQVIDQLYKRGNPTAYLANFAHFLNKTKNSKWRKDFLFPIFQAYVDIRIKQYSEYNRYDLHFVGSIAYFYADLLREVIQYNNLTCTSIIQKPIDGLVDYYK